MLHQSAPLDGVVVVDLAQEEAGASCAQLLAWLGACVIKIEAKQGGDSSRRLLADDPQQDAIGFLQFNSNKQSVALSHNDQQDRALFNAVLNKADVLIDDGNDAFLSQFGLKRADLTAQYPNMILAAATLSGQHKSNGAVDALAQVLGGAASTTGFPDQSPMLSGASVGSINTGMHLVIGVLTAIYQRQKTHQGQTVSVSMPDSVLNLCRVKLRDQQRLDHLGILSENGPAPKEDKSGSIPRIGNASGGGQPGMMIACKGSDTDLNAYVYFINQDHNWPQTCEALGKPEWKDDAVMSTEAGRMAHAAEILAAIEAITKQKNKHEAQDYFDGFGVPCAAVLDMKEILHDPALRQSDSIVEVSHPSRGSYFTVGCPIKFSAFTPIITAAPTLGQHNEWAVIHYSK
jgi:formyl-CoA transferase